jgi:hypothetical protein
MCRTESDYRTITCGLTYDQIVAVAISAPNKRAAAKKLGVGEDHFRRVVKNLGMGHWFSNKKTGRSICLTKDDIVQLAKDGYNMKDAAFVAGVNYSYFKKLVADYGVNDSFPTSGKASWISRRGYAA